MATAQVEAGDLHFTAIRNIPCAAVAIQLWTNGDARGGVAPLESERKGERGCLCMCSFTTSEASDIFLCLLFIDS